MTLKEAAAELGVTPDNLRGAIARGTLRAKKLGRDWIVTSKEVERYRAEHRRHERIIEERIADSADEIALAEEGMLIAAPVTDD